MGRQREDFQMYTVDCHSVNPAMVIFLQPGTYRLSSFLQYRASAAKEMSYILVSFRLPERMGGSGDHSEARL
jgi:hypothetical protein